MLKVEQRHREAAAGVTRLRAAGLRMSGKQISAIMKTIERGGADDDPLVQAFARFEQDHLTLIEGAVEALEPFAACMEYIASDEDDEEWAKFRLLVKDYRRADAILSKVKGTGNG